MKKKYHSVIFYPTYAHFFRAYIISLSITMSFVAFFYRFVEVNPVLGFLELFGHWYYYLPFFIMLIKTSGFIIFLPMAYRQYSIHVKTDGLSGANSFIPFFSQRTFLSWNEIKHITYSDNFFYPAIFLYSKDLKKQIIIPMGLKDKQLFLEKIFSWSTEKSSAQLLSLVMNSVEKNRAESCVMRFKGVCINEGKFPVTFKTISINYGLAQITETQTDMKGQFSFEWSFMKGSYTLSLNALDYQGEIPIIITKEYLKPVIFPVKRIYFSQNKA